MSDRIPWAIIAKYLAGECSEEERLYLESWLEEPDHSTLFKEIKESWETQSSAWNNKSYDIEKGLQRLNSKILKEKNVAKEGERSESKNRIPVLPWWSLAASILIALTVAVFIGKRFLSSDQNSPDKRDFYVTRKSGANEKIRITLPDGSQVWLNELSTIRYPENFEKNKREVLLSGEAFFDVIPDKKKPFFVRTTQITTRVLGTSFNVNAYQKEPQTKVTVETGRVAVMRAEDKDEQLELARLSPQQELVVNNQSDDTYINIVSAAEIASWREDRLVFRSNTYEEVCKVLEEKYGVKIDIKNSRLKQCKVMATFDKKADIMEVMKLLSLSNSFTFTQKKQVIIIEGGVCR